MGNRQDVVDRKPEGEGGGRGRRAMAEGERQVERVRGKEEMRNKGNVARIKKRLMRRPKAE